MACHDKRRLAERVVVLRDAGGRLAGITRRLAQEGVTKLVKARDAKAGRYRGCWYLEADCGSPLPCSQGGLPDLSTG